MKIDYDIPFDMSVATTVITTPLWLHALDGWLQFFLAAGGLVLLILRILVTWRDYRRKPPKS